MTSRRRALLLGGLALALGGLAAHNVAGREAALERRVGGLVDVVVARAPIASGAPVHRGALAVRRVPGRFAPDGAIAQPDTLAGLRAAVDIAAGTDITTGMVGDGQSGSPAGPPIRNGERVAQLMALGSPELVTAGSRVDILVTPEPEPDEAGSAVLALESVEVLAAAPAQDEESAPAAKAGRPFRLPNSAVRLSAQGIVPFDSVCNPLSLLLVGCVCCIWKCSD